MVNRGELVYAKGSNKLLYDFCLGVSRLSAGEPALTPFLDFY